MRSTSFPWDVFIAHASEDKDAFVRPLARSLKDLGVRVWYDEFTLELGDSLRRSIDLGLGHSRYGIVVVSPSFLGKKWPERECDALFAREEAGEKVILPIWYGLDQAELVRHSPLLASRIALDASSLDMHEILWRLVTMIRPDVKSTGHTKTVAAAFTYAHHDQRRIRMVPLDRVLSPPIVHSELPRSQLVRIKEICRTLGEVMPGSSEDFVDQCQRLDDPEPLIHLFEDIASIYRDLTTATTRTIEQKRQLFSALGYVVMKESRWAAGEAPNVDPALLRQVELAYASSVAGYATQDPLASQERELEMFRDFERMNPGIFARHMAPLLRRIARGRMAAGRQEAAIAAIDEAVALLRSRGDAGDPRNLSELAASLADRLDFLVMAGQYEDAFASGLEACSLYERLIVEGHDAFEGQLPSVLFALANCAGARRQFDEALAYSRRAEEAYESLPPEGQERVLPDLAACYCRTAQWLDSLGRYREAIAACDSAIELWRRLLRTRGDDGFASSLANALLSKAILVARARDARNAIALTEEAVSLSRGLANQRRGEAALARMLTEHGGLLASLGRAEEALLQLDEAVAIYHSLVAAGREALLPELATAHEQRATTLESAGRDMEAEAAREEAHLFRSRLANFDEE